MNGVRPQRLVEHERRHEVSIALGDVNGLSAHHAFFGLCREVHQHEGEDMRVASNLRQQRGRNNLMHGWWLQRVKVETARVFFRSKAAKREPRSSEPYNAEDIDALTETLGNYAIEFGEICLSGARESRMSDYFTVERSGVIAPNGPAQGEVVEADYLRVDLPG
jgi:hypothetical protein